MAPPVLTLKNVGIFYGIETLFSGIDLALQENDQLCLVGRNGSGKSTLMKVIAGLIEPDEGERFVRPGVHLAYLEQEPDFSGFKTIGDYVAQGLAADEQDAAHKVEAILASLSLTPTLDPAHLSGGELRRSALARTLIGDPEVLLLDEPTNHLDLPTIEWLENYLKSYRGAFILISHDRAFLTHLTRACLWLEGEELKRHNKGFADFERWSEAEFDRVEEERRKLDAFIRREVSWAHKGTTARRKKNMGRLRRLYALRDERRNQILRVGKASLGVDVGQASGTLVIEASHASVQYPGTDKPIIRDFSTRVMRGDKVGIVGPNGSGKTTLLNLLTGKLAPSSGMVRLGTNLSMLTIDQKRADLDPDTSLWETLCEGGGDQVMVRGAPVHVMTYLKDFLFLESQARQPVKSLSGGERNRLLLAKALAKPSNFMVLDEPTNDLDMETLDLLQDLLFDYEGTVLLVSHDRDFLDRVVTSTIVLDGSGDAIEYAGGYTDMLAQRQGTPFGAKETGSDARKKDKGAKAPKDKKSPTKLSYKHEHRAKELARDLPEQEALVAKLEAELSTGNLYQSDPDLFAQKAKSLEAARQRLGALEDEWLEIETLREALDQ
ncbi:MAG: ATP-binding cassette domain-containing protein [Alphaproteobacteria bacterium]|nr:MAG: ATP-binding cassette domain-containing protein [Alphaproteobacteria bacterium]